MSTIELPAVGTEIQVQVPGYKRPQAYVVLAHDIDPAADHFFAAQPSRQHPGDFRSGTHRLLVEWIVQ